MKYAIYVDSGEGCDYSIACGEKMFILVATNREDVVLEVKKMFVGDEVDYYGTDTPTDIKMFSFDNYETLPILSWYNEYENKIKKEKELQYEKQERAEYKRLKEKYDTQM